MSKSFAEIESQTIDWLRPVMAFMVVCLHTQLFYDVQWALSGGAFDIFIIFICKIICPVAVPAFFFVSGYLFYKGLEQWDWAVWRGKMIKRIRSLLIPFVLWNLIALLAFPLTRWAGSIVSGVPIDDLWGVVQDRGLVRLFWDRTLFNNNIQNTVNILGWVVPCGQPMNTPLWFVRDLMVVVLFSPVIHWLVKKIKVLFIVLLAALYIADIWIPVSGFGIRATFFFSFGSYFAICRRQFIESFRNAKISAAVLVLVSLCLLPFLWSKDIPTFKFALRVFIIVFIMFVFNIISILIENGRLKVNRKLADSSFFVYCSHMVIIISVIMGSIMLVPTRSEFVQIILFIVGTVGVFVTCHLLFLLMDRFCPSLLRLLTGGRQTKTSEK
ncbi:MAG: acyltransferase [Salinivirgaceae bacterium]|nr:acyltransferase [Salinivirgaceae bacterium]